MYGIEFKNENISVIPECFYRESLEKSKKLPT